VDTAVVRFRESIVPCGTDLVGGRDQTLRVWLISGVASRLRHWQKEGCENYLSQTAMRCAASLDGSRSWVWKNVEHNFWGREMAMCATGSGGIVYGPFKGSKKSA